jgi:uncharacterized protein (DUF488 family)
LENNLICYTIGHSSQTSDAFEQLLKTHQIKYLADVRSAPYSKFAPQFNRELLQSDLKSHGIQYMHMGKELGARHEHPSLLFADGKVDFSKVRQTGLFISGVEKILHGVAQGHRIVLMCSEKDPYECHRFCLISPTLSAKGIHVLHILQDGSLVANEELEERLLGKYRRDYNQISLFEPTKSREEFLLESYTEHNRHIAYSREEEEGRL